MSSNPAARISRGSSFSGVVRSSWWVKLADRVCNDRLASNAMIDNIGEWVGVVGQVMARDIDFLQALTGPIAQSVRAADS